MFIFSFLNTLFPSSLLSSNAPLCVDPSPQTPILYTEVSGAHIDSDEWHVCHCAAKTLWRLRMKKKI